MQSSDIEKEWGTPQLGARLLEDPRGDLPLACFLEYVYQRTGDLPFPFLSAWAIDPSRRITRIEPQKVIVESSRWVRKAMACLKSGSPTEAQAALESANDLLVRGLLKRRRGQPSKRHLAVRAYVVRKLNPDPAKADESMVSWAKLADLLFVNNSTCPNCGFSQHRYDSACVKTLMAGVTRLKAAMKREGIPV